MSSGIVRKIDSLGRIVIPIELRKNLNIKRDSDLEMEVLENKIIIQKSSKLEKMKDVIDIFSSVFQKKLKSDFLITDTEKVLSSSLNIKNIYFDKNISTDYYKIISERKNVYSVYENKLKIINNEIYNGYYFILPIIIDTNLLGSITLIDNKSIHKDDIFILEIILEVLKNL